MSLSNKRLVALLMLGPILCGIASAGAGAVRMDFTPSFAEKFAATATPQKMYTVKRCVQPPVIDGNIDDACWTSLEGIDLMGGAPETKVRACYDEGALYLAYECQVTDGRPPKAQPRDRDGAVWDDDAIEICVGSPHDRNVWRHFIVNAANSVCDRKMRLAKSVNPYDPDYQHATKIEATRWLVEVAIPCKALDLDRWPARLGFNVGRDGPSTGERFWTRVRRDTTLAAFNFEGVAAATHRSAEADTFVSNQPVSGASLGVCVDRLYARPGERWIEVDCRISPTQGPLNKTRMDVSVFSDMGQPTAVERRSIVPERQRGRLEIDLRVLKLAKAKVLLELFEGTERTGASEFWLMAQPCATPLEPGKKVAVRIDTPAGLDQHMAYPVTFGVPFPAGAVWNVDGLRLVDKQGNELPCQKEVTGLWAAEGSVKWVRFDARVTPAQECFVEPASPESTSTVARKLRLVEKEGKIEIETGVARYVLAKGRSPVEQVWVGGNELATSAGTKGLYLIDQAGRVASAISDEETMTVEAAGPVATCVKFEGWYATAEGQRLARHITRVECIEGEAAASITHTLVLTEDTTKIWFKEVGWEFALTDQEAGRALFAIDKEAHEKTCAVKLEGKKSVAYMLQDTHYFFGHGTNRFHVGVAVGDGKYKIETDGGECGDYAALMGKDSGLSLICRDTARQHPKEFEATPGRLTLKLFSSRGGEALDFRAQTLIKKWDLANWHKHAATSIGDGGLTRNMDVEKEFKNYVSNAAGWSKTHLLKIVPLAGADADRILSRESLKLKHTVYGFVDPHWLYATRALGPLYPQDHERFAETETMISAYVQTVLNTDAQWGENGFVDYAAGPEFAYQGIWPVLRRNGLTYLLRPGLWQLYARSGDRALREFAEETTRTCMDGRHGQWDTAVSRKGMLRWVTAGAPFYWAPNWQMEYGNTTTLNHLIWQYYLTGYRRAGDVMRDFSAGIKKQWTPRAALFPTYPPNILWHLAQCYGFTHDRQIRDLAEATMDLFEDPEGELGFNKYANERATTYKAAILVRAYIEAWELIGKTRYQRMANAYSDLCIRRKYAATPVGYSHGFATYGAFRYDETSDPMLAESLNSLVRWATGNYLPETRDFLDNSFSCAAMSAFLTDIGYALHVVAQSDADKTPQVSWLAYEDTGHPTAIYLQKPEDGTVAIQYHTPGLVEGAAPFSAVKTSSSAAMDLFRMTVEPEGGRIVFPKDMAGYTYRMAFGGTGKHWFLGGSRFPFVFYAPGYWYPIPVQRPAARYYFRLQPENMEAQIFFEGLARLYSPSGQLYPTNGPVKGWVDLPPEQAGLWGFEPVEYKLVKTRNVPPFFAVRDPASHFIPEGVTWDREAKPAPLIIPSNSPYGDGAILTAGNQALYLLGPRTFQVLPGSAHADGDGSSALPMREGTIEFFMRPAWSSAELPDQTKRFIFAPLKTDKPSGANYMMVDYTLQGTEKNMSYIFNTRFNNSDLQNGVTAVRVYRASTFFEKGEWTHLAYVWGRRNNIKYYPTSDLCGDNVMAGEIYFNGRRSGNDGRRNSGKNSWLQGPLDYLQIGLMAKGLTNLDMAIDELRISDVQRYKSDFTPPARDEAFKVDEHTRALFHFDGNLEGVCWGDGEKPMGKIRN